MKFEDIMEKKSKKDYDAKCFFSYIKMNNVGMPHDYRIQLRKIMLARFKNGTLEDIPEEFEITLKFGTKFNIFFENKEFCNPDDKLTLTKFKWCDNIETNEPGIIE